MYRVTRTRHIRLEGGKSVVLREGPRGVRDDGEGTVTDLDAGVRKALPANVLKELIADGTIVKE